MAGAQRPCRSVGLTFDDGPDPEVTDRLLDALAGEGVHATFFFLLDSAEAAPDLVRRTRAEGHEVGLHGLDHRRLTTLPGAEVRDHLRAGRDRLTAVSGIAPRWFRPPFGGQNLRSYVEARRAGMDVVVWTAEGEDWVDRPAEAIAERAVRRAAPGGIVLLHERARPEPWPRGRRADTGAGLRPGRRGRADHPRSPPPGAGTDVGGRADRRPPGSGERCGSAPELSHARAILTVTGRCFHPPCETCRSRDRNSRKMPRKSTHGRLRHGFVMECASPHPQSDPPRLERMG